MQQTVTASEFSFPERRPTERSGPVRWLMSHALHYWYLGLVLITGAVGNALLAAVVPVLMGNALNVVLAAQPDRQELIRIAILIAISQVVRSVLQLARNFAAELTGQRIERDVREELYVSLLGKGMTFHSLQPIGDTMARATNDVREINFLFSPGINLVIGSGNFIIAPLLVAPSYHPSLVITPILFTVFYVLALWQYLKELEPVTRRVRKSFGKLNTRLAEAVDGIETVKSMAKENEEVGLFRSFASDFREAFVQQGDIEARFIPLMLMVIAQAGGLFHATYLFKLGLLDPGDVLAYFGLLLLLGFPTFVSLFAYSQISMGIAGARRILELINRETELDENISGYDQPLSGQVEFRDVEFAYAGAESVLKGISLKINPSQTVAIVGQTGTGKTTLVKMINRTYDVSDGRILVDGVDVRDWNLESLRKQISIIEQDIFLFSRSIAENIGFGKPGASREEIVQAAKLAQAHEFIISFKDGFETVIGERGVTLSGGQRQRIALARAFLTDPKILILDDSTSAIDSATEDEIQKAIHAAAEGRTTFIITHRLSQIRWADVIVVLKKGSITAVGNHEQLLTESEPYRRIFNEI